MKLVFQELLAEIVARIVACQEFMTDSLIKYLKHASRATSSQSRHSRLVKINACKLFSYCCCCCCCLLYLEYAAIPGFFS